MIKSQRITSKYFNKSKFEDVKDILRQIAIHKNTLSQYIFNNKIMLLTEDGVKQLKSDYKIVKDDYISSWNIQREYSLLVDKYLVTLKRIIQNRRIRIQKGMVFVKYKVNTKKHKKGDVKEFHIQFKSTNLSGLVKYLVYLDFSKDLKKQIYNPEVLAIYDYFQTKPYFERIVKLAKTIQTNILDKVKLKEIPEYSSVMLSNRINVAYMSFNDDKKKFKHWFNFRMKGKKVISLPLQVNNAYHKLKDWIDNEFVLSLSVKENKIDISSTIDEPEPVFKSFNKVEGLDINVKNNFAAMSDGSVFDYDRKLVKEITNSLLALDKLKIPATNKLSQKDFKKQQKLYRKLQWYVGLEIHKILNYCESNGITDLVVENLLFRDKLGVINEEFNMKYGRLLKLLHLGSVKNWFKRQAEKRGIRIHITPSQYSSITCECGNIDKENRTAQEVFECSECGHTENADLHSSKQLKERFVVDVLRERLHKLDEFGRLIPKRLNKFQIKHVLEKRFELTCSS